MAGTRLYDDDVVDLWQAYCRATGTDTERLEAAEHFGDSPAMADALLELVLAGTKTATVGLVRDFEAAGAPLPSVGGHWVVLDGQDRPRAVLRTVETRVGVLDSVDDAFAEDEGEGDRTRTSWLEGHRRYFVRQGQRQGFHFDEASEPLLFERFTVAWAPGGAQGAHGPGQGHPAWCRCCSAGPR